MGLDSGLRDRLFALRKFQERFVLGGVEGLVAVKAPKAAYQLYCRGPFEPPIPGMMVPRNFI